MLLPGKKAPGRSAWWHYMEVLKKVDDRDLQWELSQRVGALIEETVKR